MLSARMPALITPVFPPDNQHKKDCLTALSPGPRKSARQISLHLLLENACSSFILVSKTASEMSVYYRQIFSPEEQRRPTSGCSVSAVVAGQHGNFA